MYPLPDGCFAPRNHWYVAAYGSDVTRQPHERMILDEPVALYRKHDGGVVALEGRCPHRHFPLGRSRVEGDRIICGYHGLAFGPDGRCVDIPSQPTIPYVCRVKSYPVKEIWDWIWIWPGDPELADEALIPDHFELGLTNPAYTTHSGYYAKIPGRYMLMHDNLFDLTHLPHLHRETLGALSVTKPSRVERGPGWISSNFDYLNGDPPDYAQRNYGYVGMVDRVASVKLLFPALHVADERYTQAHPDAPRHFGEPVGETRHFHAITPATRHSCHYWFCGAVTSTAAEAARLLTEAVYPTIAEDISATHYIEELLQHMGERLPSEFLLKADATCVEGRRMFERACRQEETSRTQSVQARPSEVDVNGQ